MKRFQWAIGTLLLVLAPCTYGDSTPTFDITQATVFVGTDSDNVNFTLLGPGTDISGSGGISCLTWCDGQVFPPQSIPPLVFEFGGQIFIGSFATARIGGHDFDPNIIALSGFALLTDGLGGAGGGPSDCGNAALSSPVSGLAIEGGTQTNFNLKMPTGGCFNPNFDSVVGGVVYVGGEFLAETKAVPEPGTIGLMLMGLAGMVGVIRRKGACGRSPS